VKGNSSHYNPWYCYTYEVICKAADWSSSSRDVPLKAALLFSWMPNVIMNYRRDLSLPNVELQLREIDPYLAKIPTIDLWKIENLNDHKLHITEMFSVLEKCFGKVAASKFLHFSRSHFFPMFDNAIVSIQSGVSYYNFVERTRKELFVESNREIARRCYPNNLLRGWDIHRMKTRRP
jgi:hypothetical protein